MLYPAGHSAAIKKEKLFDDHRFETVRSIRSWRPSARTPSPVALRPSLIPALRHIFNPNCVQYVWEGFAQMTSHSLGIRSRNGLARRAVAALILLTAALAGHPLQTVSQSVGNLTANQQRLLDRFVAAAVERTQHSVRYDPAYVGIPYPGGDVPSGTGVCTDEVIRAYRAVGIDLQKAVHEDMAAHLSAYPSKWSASSRRSNFATDANIDHRRVRNLMVFFSRNGQTLPLTENARDYRPGDLVTWNLGGGITHIGIVVNQKSPQTGRYLIVHNIGQGPRIEDVLFRWKIIGHYRYVGESTIY